MQQLPRRFDVERITRAIDRAAVTLVIGPRQVGKTTLVRDLLRRPGEVRYFDAEKPIDATALADPYLALADLRGTIIIDEAQLLDGLLPVLRVLADRPDQPAKFVVLGSASADLIGLTAQSLAGRVEIVELGGFRLADIASDKTATKGTADIAQLPNDLQPEQALWLRGGLPRSFIATTELDSIAWRDNYITTFLSTDLPRLGSRVPTTTMRRAWTMLSHYHGQTWNGSELARSLDVDAKSARRYLDQLTDALVVRQLLPWYVNNGKRQVKAPKIYIRDSGVFHRLQSISTLDDLLSHPKLGASWEGFVIEQIGQIVDPTPMYFWSTQQGAEVDLYLEIDGRRFGFEIKRSSAPKLTKSLRIASADLDLDGVGIVYPGEVHTRISEHTWLLPLNLLAHMATAADLVAAVT